jgi:hypothetical protein
MNTYRSYKDLPALAGIASMEQAAKPGLSVEQCVARLKRLHYALKRLHQIFNNRLTAEPIYELKMGFSLHAHYCAEHVAALRKRVGEMREPPLGLDVVPHEALEIFFDEILAAPSTEELLLGVYDKAVPAILAALERHVLDTNPLADHPSIRLCRFARLELEEMRVYGERALAGLVSAEARTQAQPWLALLDQCLSQAGGLDGTAGADSHSNSKPDSNSAIGEGSPRPIQRQHSAQPYRFNGVPRRDERFPDPYNMGVNAEVFLYEPAFPPEPKTVMMFYKRLREIDVPEMMASIIAETPNQPWDYYRDMTRQLWDEARHAMMGEVGFAQLGIDWPKEVMVNFTWSLALNTQLKPIERHAVLYFIEQGLMPKTGKRFEWEVGLASHNPLSALFQDYDWADEVLHARIGRDWYLKEFSDARKAVQYGDECWSKVLMSWEAWRQSGKTAHRNWWPEAYQAACRTWGRTPDPTVLAYATTYETVRADLKNLSASG